MEIQGGDVIGEDSIWFDRDCTYTAKALSNKVNVLTVEDAHFVKYFGKVIPATMKTFETRCQFMQERYDRVQFQMEYRCLKFNK